MGKKKETEINEFNFNDWLESLKGFKLPKLDDLPTLDLYMDQVLTYIGKELEPMIEDSNYLTAAMINNYVKGKVIDAPMAKKYNANNLAQLLFISSVKQVLSIKEIKELLDNNVLNQYNQLVDFQSQTVNNTVHDVQMELKGSNEKEILYKLALKFAIEAEIKKIIVSKIMDSVK